MAAGGEKDGKTEKPTGKKKSEARQEGNIARSQELVSWTSIFVGFTIVQHTVKHMFTFLRTEMNTAAELMAHPSTGTDIKFMTSSIEQSFVLIMPLVLTFMVLGIIGHVAQVRFVLSTKSLKPKLSRLNPLPGFKRLFSMNSSFNAVKEILKTLAFGGIAYHTLWNVVMELVHNGPYSVSALVAIVVPAVVRFVKEAAFVGILIGIADYLHSRRKTGKSLMMSKQDVKDEYKQQELPAEVKSRQRQKQRELSRNRMMAAIKTADVVIVNPVHIAMALKYDPTTGAPKVVAKGAGFIAEKIRDRAEEENVPLVQDIPLARALHRACDIDDEIPYGMFEAVARVLAFVYGLRNRGTASGYHKMPGTPSLEEVEREEARTGNPLQPA